MKPYTKKQAWIALFISPFSEAAFFCFYWNVLKVYDAVGHGLGTVDYLTALGVNLAVSGVISALAGAAYSGVRISKRIIDAIHD